MKILFVCSGNTCRSPLAEALARKVAIERGLVHVEIASAGTSAGHGSGASDGALLVGLERNMDLSQHRSQPLTAALVAANDLMLGMSDAHVAQAEQLGGRGRSYLLSDYATQGVLRAGVIDPFGGELETYRATADELEKYVRSALDRAVAQGTPNR